MDSNFRYAYVDQSLHLPLPHADTPYQGSAAHVTMGRRIFALLQYHPYHNMGHAMPASARSVG